MTAKAAADPKVLPWVVDTSDLQLQDDGNADP